MLLSHICWPPSKWRVSENEMRTDFELLSVDIWRQRGEGSDYDLKTAEVTPVLTVGQGQKQDTTWPGIFGGFLRDANEDTPKRREMDAIFWGPCPGTLAMGCQSR